MFSICPGFHFSFIISLLAHTYAYLVDFGARVITIIKLATIRKYMEKARQVASDIKFNPPFSAY